MADRRAWIFAETTRDYGTLHIMRALALAQACPIEGVVETNLIVNKDAEKIVSKQKLKDVEVQVLDNTGDRDALVKHIMHEVSAYTHPKNDTRHPKPLVFLCSNEFDVELQHTLYLDGCEVILVTDEALDTWADFCILPVPYASELEIANKNGQTRILRGGHYDMFRTDSMRQVIKQRDHRTYAAHFAIATENLDASKWLPLIVDTIAGVEKPDFVTGDWEPKLTLLPGPFCPSDDELKKLAGDKLPVTVYNNRYAWHDVLPDIDMLFSANNIVLQESLALGTPRVCLPRAGSSKDLMADHMQRRELSLRLPAFDASDFADGFSKELTRVIFDPASRRALMRVGQYVCDGVGSLRTVRQVVFEKYTDLQHLTRFFELGDPLIEKV